jgi:3-phenylpropionate/trans-cinnamate dioxygenase ferredoxin reductase subunit
MSEAAYVVIGAGVAGARAVEALRKDHVDGRVIVIGDETLMPYERPELSKAYLAGTKELADFTIRDEAWFQQHDVELMLGRTVHALDRANQVIELDDHEHMGYDRLLLACGSTPKKLLLPGSELAGVYYLRRLGDSDAIRAVISEGGPMVVIGAGWIGMEVAAVARDAGADVTVLEMAHAPLQHVVGEEVGGRFAQLHRSHGTQVRTDVTITRITGTKNVEGVELGDGTVVPAKAVIAGVGVRPNTELAEQSGLEIDNGVLTDASLRTSDPHIWAAGDVANCENSWVGGRLRVEHFATADEQGAFAGHGMAGAHETWGVAPFFWSDQYDVGLEYRGWAHPERSRLVTRGQVEDGQWAAFWLDEDNRIKAGMHVNMWDDADTLRDLVVDRRLVIPRRLADPAIPLADISNR